MQHVQQGPVQLLALNITQVAKTLGLSRAKVYALIATEVFGCGLFFCRPIHESAGEARR